LSINENTIREYQEILSRRTEINGSVGRYIVDLIKTLRETFPQRDNKKNKEDIHNLEKDNPLAKTSQNKTSKASGF
jgi:hypothetical protein